MPELAQQVMHACVQDSFVTPNSESTHINFLDIRKENSGVRPSTEIGQRAVFVGGKFDGTAEMHAKEYLYPSLYPGISRIAIYFRGSCRERSGRVILIPEWTRGKPA